MSAQSSSEIAMPKSKAEKSLDSVIDAAMKAAETQGWATVTLYDIAQFASVPLDELYETVGSKQQILNAFARRVDKAVLSDFERDTADSVRDRLFEMILARFDEMLPYREGLKSIANASMTDGSAAICGYQRLSRSMRWTMDAAGVSTSGIAGTLKVKFLVGVYLRALRVWLTDETEDFAKTMKVVDQSLAQAERWASYLNDKRAGSKKSQDDGFDDDGVILET
jgi:AcrR family transcriptional regulator